MILRTQRLHHAHRLLPFIIKRFNTTYTPADGPKAHENHVYSHPGPITTPGRIGKDLGDETPSNPSFEARGGRKSSPTRMLTRENWTKLNDSTAIKKYLADGYQIGGYLEQAQTSQQHKDANGLPVWGESGIALQFRTSYENNTHISYTPNFWLRDHCRCNKCVNQDTMQRAFDTFSIPADIMPKTVLTEEDGLRVTWANDDHVSFYPWSWLWKHARRSTGGNFDTWERVNQNLRLWNSGISTSPPSVSYDEIMADDRGVGRWTAKLRQYGFCYVDGCPVSPEKTKKLLERIAFIRVTHYGGFYDFTSDLTMKDTAYTSLALGSHTDTTYFTDPAGLQMFHLLSHTDGDGGASLLVDGFKAASILRKESRSAFTTLARTPISWHASGNEGITITPAKKFPVLNFGTNPFGPIKGTQPRNSHHELLQVRWNNDDRGLVDLKLPHGEETAESWYAAARKFDEILKRDDMQYWAQLEPGRPLIFDNWRVLHGRSAFTGKRRMCGGYINHDDFISRWRNTNFTRDEALRQIL